MRSIITINRPRNSGKTTILLHHMVVNLLTVYVARTERIAGYAYCLSQNLKLNLASDRFMGATCDRLERLYQHGYKILIDDIDYIIRHHPVIGSNLIARASVITTTE